MVCYYPGPLDRPAWDPDPTGGIYIEGSQEWTAAVEDHSPPLNNSQTLKAPIQKMGNKHMGFQNDRGKKTVCFSYCSPTITWQNIMGDWLFSKLSLPHMWPSHGCGTLHGHESPACALSLASGRMLYKGHHQAILRVLYTCVPHC